MTTEEFSQKAQQIWDVIQKSQNILLHLHPSPDPDSAGSALAMYWMLKDLGKNPTVIKGDSDIPNWLEFLPGGNLVISKNFTEINIDNFDTFIILDTGGLNQITKKSEVVFPEKLNTVLIDHHSANHGFAKINILDLDTPSTTQTLYKLFKIWQIKITSQIAACLLAGIYSDTGGFKYQRTTSETFRIASELWEIYPNYSQLIFDLDNQNDWENLKYSGLALSNIHIYKNFAISEISYEQLLALNIRKMHTEKTEIANTLKSVKGCMMGISFVEAEKNIISISFRTRDEDKYDVAKIAVATKCGGGHRVAAGATLKMPFEQAKKFLLDTIYSIYPDLKPTS